MAVPVLIAGEDGTIITGEDGIGIAGDIVTSNADIQKLHLGINVTRAILWQYNNAPNLQSLVNSKQTWLDANYEDFWNDWIANVFTLMTANEFGLDVWSIILDLPLFVNEGATPSGVLSFGFGPDNGNFGNSNFGNLNGVTVNFSATTQRIALLLRYFQLCSSGTVPEINRFMNYVFSAYGKVFLVDNHDMTQIYVFLFPLTFELQYLFNNFDLLARPAGVKSTYRDGTINSFGFGPLRLGFGQGNFGG
jgi:hypothetical protein